MEEKLIDLAIVGGGPAGTATALEARHRGLRVSIWDRDRFPRDKVCGEFLSAESLPWLETEIPSTLSRGTAIRRSEFVSRSGRSRAFALPMCGRGLSRRALDEALWRRAGAASAESQEGEGIRRIHKINPGRGNRTLWELESSLGKIQRAGALVIACGRWWKLDGLPGPAQKEPKERNGNAAPGMGAKAHFSGIAARDAVEMYFFPGGYCGLAPIEDGLYNACCLVHRNLARECMGRGMSDFGAWLRGVARHPALDARLRAATQVSETLATAPLRPARRVADREGALWVGDAAGFLDPFTGDGISMALHSGRLAAEELARALEKGFEELDFKQVVEGYRRNLARAVRRSYRVAGLLRTLVSAPESVQTAMAAALPWLGARLLAETRWRAP